jgi:predicted regulator of Ras-like GTPase activity (Roadblock/LC7/MglB family)
LACNNQILNELGKLQGVFGAELDRIDGLIVVSHTDEVSREEIVVKLELMGFSERKENQAIGTDEPSIWGCAL